MGIKRGDMLVSHSSRGRATYKLEISHTDLHKHRVIRGDDPSVVATKADLQIQEWKAQWSVRSNKDALRHTREEQKQTAVRLTEEAKETQEALANLLKSSLGFDDRVDWDSLKDHSEFPTLRPKKPQQDVIAFPSEPRLIPPNITWTDRLIPGRADQKRKESTDEYERTHHRWEVRLIRFGGRFSYAA